MSRWIFEPGHTEAEFRARHMMVTWVRGLFKDIHGAVDATRIWTGEETRDAHLRSPDFFDVQHHPRISFTGHVIERTGDMHAKASVDPTIREITRPVILDVAYHGQWEISFLVVQQPPSSTLFPYTTLFRSGGGRVYVTGPAGYAA